jgi:hypothetical protein
MWDPVVSCCVCSFVGILEDISWKKEAEESLRRSEERYVLAVRGSNDGLWDWDMVANQVFYSQRYKHMLGLGATDVDDSLGVFESRLHPKHRGTSLPGLLKLCIATVFEQSVVRGLWRKRSSFLRKWGGLCEPFRPCDGDDERLPGDEQRRLPALRRGVSAADRRRKLQLVPSPRSGALEQRRQAGQNGGVDHRYHGEAELGGGASAADCESRHCPRQGGESCESKIGIPRCECAEFSLGF